MHAIMQVSRIKVFLKSQSQGLESIFTKASTDRIGHWGNKGTEYDFK